MAERSEAIVLRKTEEDRTKFCSVRWSVLASLSEYMFGFEVDKFSNKKKRPAVLIINEEVDCTRSISSLLHIYRKRCTENVSLLVKTKEPNSNSTNQNRQALCSETKEKNEKWQELLIKEKEERKEKRGSKGVSPLALQTQTCQKNNLVVKTMVQEKFIFSSIRLKEVAGKYRRSNEAVCALFVQLFL